LLTQGLWFYYRYIDYGISNSCTYGTWHLHRRDGIGAKFRRGSPRLLLRISMILMPVLGGTIMRLTNYEHIG